jgi:hypothetical protein
MYHKIESINYQDLLNEKSFMAADIICLVEIHNEESIDYKIPGYIPFTITKNFYSQ